MLMLTLERLRPDEQLSALTKKTNPVCSLHPQRDAYINLNKPDLMRVIAEFNNTETSTNELM